MSFTSSFQARLGCAALTAAALFAGTRADATVGPYSVSYDVESSFLTPPPDNLIGWPVSLSLPKFDIPFGILCSVELTFISYIRLENVGLENTSVGVGSTINFYEAMPSKFNLPTAPTPVNLTPDIAFSDTFLPYDGTLDFDGPSGETYAQLDDSDTTTVNIASVDFGAYTGPGNFMVTYEALLDLAQVTTDAGKTFEFLTPDALAKGRVEVRFTYDVPETSTVAGGAGLALLLAAAGWRSLRRRA